MKHTKKQITTLKDVYITFDGKEFDTESEALNHEEWAKDEIRDVYNHYKLVKEFESLVKDRAVFFAYDYADGFFIKVTGDDGFNDNFLNVAELNMEQTRHHTIEGAMEAAIEYLKKKNR